MMMRPDLPDVVELAVPFFVFAIALELLLGFGRRRVRVETGDSVLSVAMGVGHLIEVALFGAVTFAVWESVSAWAPWRIADQPWGWSPWVFLVAFIVDDLRYYWWHRFSHQCRWMWAAHVNHHSSQHYNLTTALRQEWTGILAGAFLFSIPLIAIGFDPAMIAFTSGLNLVYQFWIHTEAIVQMPAWFEAVFNTPSHHRVHHARNARYLDANYAGTFIIWDRLFGTFVPEQPEDEEIAYGLVTNLGTRNLLRIAFHEWMAIASDATRRGLSFKARIGYLFGPPGWSHDQSRKTTRDVKRDYVRRNPNAAGAPGLPLG